MKKNLKTMLAIGLFFATILGSIVTTWANPIDVGTEIEDVSFVIEDGRAKEELCAEHIVLETYDDIIECNSAKHKVNDENWKYAPESYDDKDIPFISNCVILRVNTDASFAVDAEHIVTIIQYTKNNSFYIQYDSEDAAKEAVKILNEEKGIMYATQNGYGIEIHEPEQSTLPYVDVLETDWFYSAVKFLYRDEIMTGESLIHFGPYNQLSRAQLVLILYRMEEEPKVTTNKRFHDISGDEWYGPAVLWAAEIGIVTGYENGYFGPADYITREQLAAMMYRYANYLNGDVTTKADINKFADSDKVSDFATEALSWANGMGIITGKENGTLLDPQGNTTRCEAAVVIQRFMENNP